ncbi:hypothetical protein [Sorangium sp. So ce124]|uniref:hypothetical protein n=1 Tax=Sorangium sp. So ce124 TaxID=3133280 RepID=UPI003F5FBD1B
MGRRNAHTAAVQDKGCAPGSTQASEAPALPLAAGVMVCLGGWARRCKVRC